MKKGILYAILLLVSFAVMASFVQTPAQAKGPPGEVSFMLPQNHLDMASATVVVMADLEGDRLAAANVESYYICNAQEIPVCPVPSEEMISQYNIQGFGSLSQGSNNPYND